MSTVYQTIVVNEKPLSDDDHLSPDSIYHIEIGCIDLDEEIVMACKQGWKKAIVHLVNCQTRISPIAIRHIIRRNDVDMMKVLIDMNAQWNVFWDGPHYKKEEENHLLGGCRPIHFAAQIGKAEIFKLLMNSMGRLEMDTFCSFLWYGLGQYKT